MLHEFLTANTREIVARTRAKVAARTIPLPTEAELENGVPLFLSQLIDRLRLATTDSAAIQESASLHGSALREMGFSVSQVVHGYGDVCQVVTELADETRAEITADEFHTFNRCLDDAIAHSVTAYEQRRDESRPADGTERLGALAHELRNHLAAAMLSFRILQKGTVAIGGSTGAVLGRNLRAMRDLIDSSLVDVRLDVGLGQRRPVSVSELLGEVEAEAAMGAEAGGFRLSVSSVARGVEVQVDPQILSAAINNLLQNAFKFSPPRSLISLRATATDDRVVFEVEDECGGLPPGRAEQLFEPFEQRGDDRTGLGLGLSISRKGIEAMGGTISVRDLPSVGCIFSIELPRSMSA